MDLDEDLAGVVVCVDAYVGAEFSVNVVLLVKGLGVALEQDMFTVDKMDRRIARASTRVFFIIISFFTLSGSR